LAWPRGVRGRFGEFGGCHMSGVQASRFGVRTIALLSISTIALTIAVPSGADAQSTPTPGASQLPPVQVDEPNRRPRRAQAAPRSRVGTTATRTPRRNPRPAEPTTTPAATAAASTFDARTGTVGIYSNSTSVATKTNTPLRDIPQSLTVLTKTFIQDQGFQSLTDYTRYVPGVAIHQGEGNRDELVIRGVDSSANFFVNGFRDDVQYFRDLYNTQSLEILKGPSALIFGRGAGGGLVNRTLKEADWTTVRQVIMTTGSWADRRVATDFGQAINDNVAVRLNAFYEKSDTFRDYGNLERYGINPTASFKLGDDTKLKLSYEYFHDVRLADRGNPSQAVTTVAPGSTRFNPALPFVSDVSTFFGSPIYNITHANVHTAMSTLEHDFGNGLTVKNGTLFASYLRDYRNIYPGNGTLLGAVNPAQTSMNLAAYENATNRNNLFNQTDFTYKGYTGPVRHTLMFGTEFGLQAGLSQRDTGFFPQAGGANTITVNPFFPTFFGPVNFIHQASDASSRYRLNIQSGYVQDQVDVTRWLQLIGGVRYDRFDLSALDQNTNTTRGRVDEKVSPKGAVIVKPVETVSVYGAYSISYLPASGDQFSTLTPGTLILDPQKFENKEVGVKWNINPKLLFSAAVYELVRTNVPIADLNNVGFFFPSGSHKIRGFETSLNGYVTADWQSQLGYAYTDARITSATSTTIVPGNIVQLVPLNQFSWWNKYQFDPIWAAAVGMIYFSDSFAGSDNIVKLPSWWRFDAAVYAKFNETWKFQVNVENIFDKLYWASADGNNNLSPGQSRTVRLTAIANF
jgi:catecholate siderophore receptor